MVIPTTAIARVRTSSRVRSATMARIVEPTAPAPCRMRPSSTPSIEVASAATTLPTPNSARPAGDHHLRPMRSERSPSGICSRPLSQSVGAERQADHLRARAGKALRILRENGIDHEQPEQPRREHGRQADRGAKLGLVHLRVRSSPRERSTGGDGRRRRAPHSKMAARGLERFVNCGERAAIAPRCCASLAHLRAYQARRAREQAAGAQAAR